MAKPGVSQIEHVIVLMLENRSFDHLLAYSGIPGLKGVDTSKANPGPSGSVAMSDRAPDRARSDPGHEFEDVDWQLYQAPRVPSPRPIVLTGFVDTGGASVMRCASPARVPVLTHLARNFLVCDQWFSSMPGPTWPNRFFVHAGSSGGLANSPSIPTMLGSMTVSALGFSFQNGTIFDRLTRARKTWRVYHGDHFPQVCAITGMSSIFVGGTHQFRPQKRFAADVARGDVAHYTFIEPKYSIFTSFRRGDSQHPAGTLSAGERLIAEVSNALMSSPVWMTSLLLIFYDEHGGFYDQLEPDVATPPGDDSRNAEKAQNPPNPPFGFDRLGIRVPAVVVSPWVKPGCISSQVYDHASVIRTVFELFGLPGFLTRRDRDAKSLKSELLSTPVTETPALLPKPPRSGSGAGNLPPRPPSSGTLNGFTRIAVLVDHALRKYQAHVSTGSLPETLGRVVGLTDNLTYLDLPRVQDPRQALRYMRRVASAFDKHRTQQESAG